MKNAPGMALLALFVVALVLLGMNESANQKVGRESVWDRHTSGGF